MSITPEEADLIMKKRSNGALLGISSGKGGRAWLDGEWQLEGLEALCIKIREQCRVEGVTPVGTTELIAIWNEMYLEGQA